MIDHLGLTVANYDTSKAFYLAALAPIGNSAIMECPRVLGLGERGKPDFWITEGGAVKSIHIAFRVPNRALVDAFYSAAIAAGGKDNGGPCLRPEYHPNYYGAFVFDPDGHDVEAVCHDAEA